MAIAGWQEYEPIPFRTSGDPLALTTSPEAAEMREWARCDQ
jgi:hypothetical protein